MSQFVVLNLSFGKSFTEKATFEQRSSYRSEIGEGDQNVQTSYLINHGLVIFGMVTIINNTVLHIGKLVRE